MDPVNRSTGQTDTEQYLAKLCENTFLSLWSYPNLFTNEGRRNGKGAGKELCDLLIVFGSDILIFSDKDVRFNSNIDTKIAWNRWRKRAINESARQLYGAEKWIREHPADIFLDPECTQRFPLEIEDPSNIHIHLIAVTKNTALPAQRFFAGRSSGSLMLIPRLTDKEISEAPFITNDIDPEKTFVHVFDEVTLSVIFGEIDTTYDLVRYLRAKEKAIRTGLIISVPGEEDLLAYYMLNGGLVNDQPFSIPKEFNLESHGIMLTEGFWHDYLYSQERHLMREANQVSYFWDALIENFAKHILAGTVGLWQDNPTSTHEQAIRYLAAEGRFGRRFLANMFIEKMAQVPPDRRSSRVCPSVFNPSVCFILVLYPRDAGEDYENYREQRVQTLHAYATVAQYKFPQYSWIILIGTEPQTIDSRSEDVLAVQIQPLSEEEKQVAIQIMIEEDILNNTNVLYRSDCLSPNNFKEKNTNQYAGRTKISRNESCPCGSGKKWKKCCGAL